MCPKASINTWTSYFYQDKTKMLPYIECRDIFYRDTNKYSNDKIQLLQNRALRICLNVPCRTNVGQIHREAGINYLEERRKYHIKRFAFERQMMGINIAPVKRLTRLYAAPVFDYELPRYKIYEYSMHYKCAQYWNTIPVEDRNIQNIIDFKKKQIERLQSERLHYV